VSRPDPLPGHVRRGVEDLRARESDRRLDIIVEGVRPDAGLDLGRVRAAVARVDGGAVVTDLPLVGAVACALRPTDVLRLAADPEVGRITLDKPEAVELGEKKPGTGRS
jgi:hypothetical protein